MPTFTDPRDFKFAYQGPTAQSQTTESRLLVASFGDGYEQVSEDGVNAERIVWRLEFVGLSQSGAAVLRSEAVRAQVSPVTYTVPGDIERVYRVQPGSVSMANAQTFQVSFTMREVFGVSAEASQTMTQAFGL